MGIFDILPGFGKKDKAKTPPPDMPQNRREAPQEARRAINVPSVNANSVAAATTPRTYTVKAGDTLSKIAKVELGDASRYMAIFEANRSLLKDPDKIFPGQVLTIPQTKGQQLHS